MVEGISDLAWLSARQTMLALAMTIMMFSMEGIPPLAGFFGKLFIFQAAIGQGLYWLAVIGVVTSVVGGLLLPAYHSRNVVRRSGDEALDPATDGRLNFLLIVSSVAVLLFIAQPGPLLNSAEAAAKSIAIKAKK